MLPKAMPKHRCAKRFAGFFRSDGLIWGKAHMEAGGGVQRGGATSRSAEGATQDPPLSTGRLPPASHVGAALARGSNHALCHTMAIF